MTYRNLSENAEFLWKQICSKSSPHANAIDREEASRILGRKLTQEKFTSLAKELDNEGLVKFSTDQNTADITLHPQQDEIQEFNKAKKAEKDKLPHFLLCKCGKTFRSKDLLEEHQKDCEKFKDSQNKTTMF